MNDKEIGFYLHYVLSNALHNVSGKIVWALTIVREDKLKQILHVKIRSVL